MKTLVVYDSVFGNTEKIARAIAGGIPGEVKIIRAGDASPSSLSGIDLLIVGSPTRGGRPTEAIVNFLKSLPANSLKGVRVAGFDTRFPAKESSSGLRLLMKIVGYAAGRIESRLKSRGGEPVSPPEGFIVRGREGPLKEGEIERAAAWAKELAAIGS